MKVGHALDQARRSLFFCGSKTAFPKKKRSQKSKVFVNEGDLRGEGELWWQLEDEERDWAEARASCTNRSSNKPLSSIGNNCAASASASGLRAAYVRRRRREQEKLKYLFHTRNTYKNPCTSNYPTKHISKSQFPDLYLPALLIEHSRMKCIVCLT